MHRFDAPFRIPLMYILCLSFSNPELMIRGHAYSSKLFARLITFLHIR